MTRLRRKVINIMSIAWFILAVAALGIIVWIHLDSKVEYYEITTIKLTDEEMANRPLMPKEEEPIEKYTEAVGEAASPLVPVYKAIPLSDELQIFAQNKCEEYEVSFTFFLAMLESESSFNAEVLGDSGNSVGYMQINKPNWDRYGLNAFNVFDNIEIGIRMMSEYIKAYGDTDMVIMCYKAGEHKANELRNEGIRLSSCDSVLESMAWWEEVLANEQ